MGSENCPLPPPRSTPPKTNFEPERSPLKRENIYKPPFFKGSMLVFGDVARINKS